MKHPIRTNQQNKALHKLYELLAEELNDSGLYMQKVLKPTVDIVWTRENVKEYLWRPIMKAQLGKESTTELTTKEIDDIFDTLNKHLGEKFGLHVAFPSIEHLIQNERSYHASN